MNIETLSMAFASVEPYYGILLSSMRHISSTAVPTMAVAKKGNVLELLYNPAFMDSLSLESAIECLKHEMLHVAFSHFNLWEVPPSTQIEAKLRNAACDLEVNSYLDENKLPGGCVLPKLFGFETKLGSREYYRRLKDMFMRPQEKQEKQSGCSESPAGGQDQDQDQDQNQDQEQEQAQDWEQAQEQAAPDETKENSSDDSLQSNGSSSDAGSGTSQSKEEEQDNIPDSFDSHDMWPSAEDRDEVEAMQQTVDALLDVAAEETEKQCGTVPQELEKIIERIRKKPKPVADWKRYFRRYIGKEFTDLLRKSRKRQSNRFPDAPGNRHQRKSHILVAIDTSGSISMPEYKEFMGQLYTLNQKATFHVVECDTHIAYEYDFNGHIPETVHGGGGTDFKPPIQKFLEERKKYDALVYFTDGCAAVPKCTPKEMIWVISSKGQINKNDFKINGASVVVIPPKA